MSHNRRAFTLIELLVVIAIIAILAAILFPVFAQAKAAAKQSADLAQSKQYTLGMLMYASDTDDYAPLVQWSNSYSVVPPNPDSTVGNLVQPYMKNYQMFTSPASACGDKERDVQAQVPSSTVPAAYKAAQILFNLALKADYGYNVEYFSPMGYDPTFPNGFHAAGTSLSSPQDPASTLLTVNSDWDRNAVGQVQGGGNWGVDMPCRIYSDGTDSLPPVPSGSIGRWWWGGWNPNAPLSWNVYGGAWPYHRSNILANVSFADGHSHGLAMSKISAGCDVQPGWGGYIFDRGLYIWDLQ